MVTDPIADFLIRLRNASMARKDVVSVPASKMTKALSELLEREGYVASVARSKDNHITITLSYKNGRATIAGAKRISKPSRRMYMSVHDVKPVKRGHGLLVLSTPAGVLTGKEAKEKHVGGEALFEIW
ncbi:MAG TPA: 30S ribosomal protein S8 [Candidatus Paceibacterota bacterium]|nr:30S ribosomal protein S8 [Candidatus Paceibacterota bacterium]